MDNVELLAPAGSLEKMMYAYAYGADAIYCGGKNFSLRANATNFSLEEMKEACEFAHSINKKMYVTVNIVFHNEDLQGLEEYLRYLEVVKKNSIATRNQRLAAIKSFYNYLALEDIEYLPR